ncbi:PHD finger protein 21A [Galendromus occidentalis]|uniref:PHD finger protein 21A n=1 Tax=Galendromus occidentalis TaxID=34638 RepID=A0AAJ6QT57_9ACAR|nr:PHD finger protein 21A [Galendromus occidentalis]
MDLAVVGAPASGETHMQNVERQIRALIREHHRLMSTVEQLSSSAAEAKLSAATRIQQEIINMAYEFREANLASRCGSISAVHINTTGAVMPKPIAQMNNAQPATISEKVALDGASAFSINNNNNNHSISDNNNYKTDPDASFDYVVKAPKKVPLPIVAPNLVFHNPAGTSPGVKFGAPPSAVFIIKVPPNQTGPLNIVTLQQNGITNGASITAPVNGLQVNGVVVKAVAPGSKGNFLPKPVIIDDSKVTSAPSPLITHKLAVQATKNIETRLQKVPEERNTLPPFEFEENEEDKVCKGVKKQAWFLGHLSLCTPERFRELSERRTERRRRKTANPHFSSAAVEERRRQETERKRKKTTSSDGKNKAELKEELQLQAEKLRTEKAELLKKHEEARQRLTEERLRTRMLVDQQRTVEQMLERLRKFMSIVAENRPPLCA